MGNPRIVHVIPSLRTGGAEVFTVNLLKAMDRRRYDIAIITLFTPEPDNFLLRELRKANVKHFALGKTFGFSLPVIFSLRSLMKDLNPQIIHTHMYTLKYVYFAHLGRYPPRWIHTVHTLASKELLRAERMIASRLFRKNIVIPIAVSQNVAQSVRETYDLPTVRVIYNRIPCRNEDKKSKAYYRSMLSLPSSKVLFINVARMVTAKNHMLLLKAFRLLTDKYPSLHLLLIGDGELRGTLENATHEFGITNQVTFVGKVTDPKPYLRAADIFVLSSCREGLPLSLLEAMQEELPVVATKTGGVSEVIDDSIDGYLVDVGDTEGLVHALGKLIDSGRRTKFGTKAKQKIAKNFNIESSAREYEAIYKQTLR